MSRFAWNSISRGAEYRAPTVRVYISPIVTVPEGGDSKGTSWLGERHAALWEPLQVRWGVNGRPSALTLRRTLGLGPDQPARERPEAGFCMPGDRIRLMEAQCGDSEGTGPREWFRGYVGQDRILVQAMPDTETFEVVAYGPEIVLQGKVVSGQWHAKPQTDDKLIQGTFSQADLSRDNTFRSHLPVIFNERGQPNASAAETHGSSACWHLDSNGEADSLAGRTFEARSRVVHAGGGTYAAALWRARSAVQSLIEMIDDYGTISPASVALLPAGLSERAIGEVNVEGMNLLEALRAVLLPIGYGFCLEPWAQADGRHILHVFELHGNTKGSRVRKPFMAPIRAAAAKVTDPEGQRAEIQRIEFVRDNHNVANDVTVVGAQKRKQVTLTFSAGDSQLQCAWDTDAYDLADWASNDAIDPMQWPVDSQGALTVAYFDEHFTYGGKGKPECQHVFRSFVWNEDGAFSAAAALGDAASYGIGDYAAYIRRPRPVGPTLLRDDAQAKVRNFPAFVQLGIDGDQESWIQIPAVIWEDRAGFTISINPLWRWYPYAAEYARHAGGSQTLFDQYGEYSFLTLLYNALRGSGIKLALRLVGSIECDEAVIGRAARRLTSSWPFAAEKVVRLEDRFVHLDVPSGSDPFALDPVRHETRDDSADAADYASRIREVFEDEVGHGSVILRHVTRTYIPGDVIPQTQGRVIDLTVRSGQGAYAPVVVGVIWHFQGGANKTELILDTPLLKASQ